MPRIQIKMIRFTREQIDEQRNRFQDSGHLKRVAYFGGESINCYMIPTEWGFNILYVKGFINFKRFLDGIE